MLDHKPLKSLIVNTNSKTIYPNWSTLAQRFRILVLIVIFGIIGCGSEEDSSIYDPGLCLVEINGVFEEVELDQGPIYLNGGYQEFTKAVGKEVKYPAEARANSVEGLCVLNYEITEEGKVENIVAIEDPGAGIGDSSIEAIKSVTVGVSFSPGILDNVPVRVKKELEIKFKLEG